MRTAVMAVHDDDMARNARWAGLVTPALLDAGYSVRVVSPLLGDALPADADVVVVMGSEASAYDDSLPWLAGELDDLHAAVDRGTPLLGICFGAQVLARVLGGRVTRAETPELGFISIESDVPDLLPSGPWLSSHYDVIHPPESSLVLARTPLAVQVFAQGPHLGVQFHPEATPDVLATWRERRDATLSPTSPQRAEWLDLEAVSASLDAERQTRRELCQGLVHRFLDGSFARAYQTRTSA